MIRNLKILGLTMAAVFAVSAMAASAASAQQGKLTADGPFTLIGKETGPETGNRLTAFGAFIQCPGSTYTGHKYNETPHKFIASGSTTVTVTPDFTQTTAGGAPNCTGPFGWSVTIDMNGCDFVTHLGETTGGVAGTYALVFDLVCPEGKEMTSTIWTSEADHTNKPTEPFCVFHYPAQTGLKGAHTTDTANGHVDTNGTVEGIRVKRTAQAADPSPVLCPTAETTTAKLDADLTGSTLNESGGATAISISE